jgi:hypothetical protein
MEPKLFATAPVSNKAGMVRLVVGVIIVTTESTPIILILLSLS